MNKDVWERGTVCSHLGSKLYGIQPDGSSEVLKKHLDQVVARHERVESREFAIGDRSDSQVGSREFAIGDRSDSRVDNNVMTRSSSESCHKNFHNKPSYSLIGPQLYQEMETVQNDSRPSDIVSNDISVKTRKSSRESKQPDRLVYHQLGGTVEKPSVATDK